MQSTMRLATTTDSEAILKIYGPFIENTAVTFETEVPSPAEFSSRIAHIAKQYPYLVCQIENDIIGYAYASRHRERAAYLYDVDVSIYVAEEYHGAGTAQKLYGCLFALLKELGYCSAYAGCTVPNLKSIHFHQKFGFVPVGTYHKTGYKFGQWHDVVWLEKPIREHCENPGAVKSIAELPRERLDGILAEYSG